MFDVGCLMLNTDIEHRTPKFLDKNRHICKLMKYFYAFGYSISIKKKHLKIRNYNVEKAEF